MHSIYLKRLGLSLLPCAAIVAAWSGSASAIPSPYVSQFGPLNIQNPTTSSLLRDSQSDKTVWVLPPTAGKTEFKGLYQPGNLGFCDGLKNLQQASNDISSRIGALAQQREDLEPELAQAEADWRAALANLGTVAQAPGMKDTLLMQDQVDGLETKREKLLGDLEHCTQSCEEVKKEFDRVGSDLKDSKAKLADLQDQNREAVHQYNLAKSQVDEAKESFDTVGARVDKLQAKLIELGNEVMELYGQQGKLEGGYVMLDYDTGWDANIAKLRGQYGASFDFEQIATANARIQANIVGASSEESYYASLPAILDYTINGTKYLPWGANDDQKVAALPSVLTGQLRLSTIGACPIAFPNFFDNSTFKPARGEGGYPLFSIGATYEYPVAFKYKVTASYNLYKFYEQIKRQGSSGGLFSSHSYSEVLENKLDRDAFSIDWQIEDPNSSWDSKTRSEITAELKKDLMNRVLVTIAQPGIPQSGTPTFIDPGVPPATGATVLANGLSDTCGWNVYCQAGSWILRGLQAIFGSSSSEQTFRSNWDRTATETWSADIATYRPGAIGFSR